MTDERPQGENESEKDPPEPSLQPTQTFVPSPGKSELVAPASGPDDTSLNDFGSTADIEHPDRENFQSPSWENVEAGDFELISELGRGGMGVVQKCRQKSLNRVVAVKSILHSSFRDEQQVARFLDEARAVAQLKHENIVAIHQVSQSSADPFFVMEYVDGKSLDQLIRTWTLDQKRAVRIIIQITRAIQEAHLQRIVHRDLKPANVLVDSNDRVKVTDFGLAKFLGADGSNTVDGQILGTPSFMAPEQAMGKSRSIDERTDIYSIGATLYACLTGTAPFRADGITEILQLVREAEPVSPRRINPNISRDIETICLKCMEKDPAKRYQTTEALISELERFLKDEPIKARPISTFNRVVRVMKKKPVQSGLLVSTAVLLLFVFTIVPALIVTNQKQKLQFAEKERRTGLENELVLSVSNGEWKNGLAKAEELLTFEPDNSHFIFQKMRCWNALGQRKKIVDELKKIEEAETDLLRQTELVLWKADTLFLGNSEHKGYELLQDALDRKLLSKPDQFYAQALLTEDANQVVALLKKAINEDPAHHRAMTFLFSTLLLSGQLEQAENRIELSLAKFPKDPNLWTMKLIVRVAREKDLDVGELKAKIIDLGGEPMRNIIDDLVTEYSLWASLMDRWETMGHEVIFQKLQQYTGWLIKFQNGNANSNSGWTFDRSVLRMPRGWRQRQESIQSSLRLLFFNQYKLAADQLAAAIDDQSTGEILFMTGQAYFVADELLKAAEYFEKAAARPSRFANLAREAYWCAAMSYATLWINDRENRELIEKAARFARLHLEHPAIHAWHEITLGKIACNAFDFQTAFGYLQRVKAHFPDNKDLAEFEKRTFSVAFVPIENRLTQLSEGALADPQKGLSELDAYRLKMIENINNKFDEVKQGLENKKN